jgi:glyceraldehyde 3-phosphate dehydrogenase
MKWAINGFGRIGRGILRAAVANNNLENCVAIHDFASLETSLHLLKYDSTFGRLNATVKAEKDALVVNGHHIAYLHQIKDGSYPWKKLSVDIVMECTGIFTSTEKSQPHLTAGAKKVLLSAPASDTQTKTIVYGINHETLNHATDLVISNASCTTNCLAPVAHVLHKELGIEHGLMCTIHSYTNDQRILDTDHKDLRRSRSAALNMIPTTTGAARAVGKVIPELNGKIDGYAIRVPTHDVSFVDFSCHLKKSTNKDSVNALFKKYAAGPLKGVLAVTDEPLVSSDFINTQVSSTVDASLTTVVDGTFLKVCSWYDNEMGFCNRMIDMANFLGKSL